MFNFFGFKIKTPKPNHLLIGVAEENIACGDNVVVVIDKLGNMSVRRLKGKDTEQPKDVREHPIQKLARENGCRFVHHQPDQRKFRFAKDKDILIDVWYSKMTVGTILTHPKKGRNALYRKNVSMETLAEIFKYPRKHTGAGYYKR